MTNSIEEFEDAEAFFVIGSNTTEQHPMIATRIIQAVVGKKARLIVADPRDIRLTEWASVCLRHKIGSDVDLIHGLMHVILKEGWEDREFIESRTENFQELKSVVAGYTPERVAEITGVDPESLKKAAQAYANSRKAMIVYAIRLHEDQKDVGVVIITASQQEDTEEEAKAIGVIDYLKKPLNIFEVERIASNILT